MKKLNKICVPLEFKCSAQDISGKTIKFSGYASVFNVKDSHGDIVKKGAFLKSIAQKSTMPLLWQHDENCPIGVITRISEDDYGLKVEGKFLIALAKAKDAYELVKNQAISGLSIGYVPTVTTKTKFGRELNEINLMEISLVTFASNTLAKITDLADNIKNFRDSTENSGICEIEDKNLNKILNNNQINQGKIENNQNGINPQITHESYSDVSFPNNQRNIGAVEDDVIDFNCNKNPQKHNREFNTSEQYNHIEENQVPKQCSQCEYTQINSITDSGQNDNNTNNLSEKISNFLKTGLYSSQNLLKLKENFINQCNNITNSGDKNITFSAQNRSNDQNRDEIICNNKIGLSKIRSKIDSSFTLFDQVAQLITAIRGKNCKK